MNIILLTMFALINFAWSSRTSYPLTVTSVTDLDECLISNKQKPTKNLKEILAWKQKLNITEAISIDPAKIQEMVEASCPPDANPRTVAALLGQEVQKIIQSGSLQISDWKVPGFPETGAKNYSMKRSAGCNPRDLLYQMKLDVDRLKPDLTNVYNLGLAIDTTASQEKNLQILLYSIDAIFESLPRDANIAFVATAYGDEFRGGLRFEGDKSYVIPRVKSFIMSQRVHGGGAPPEFVYGGSYTTSKNLGRAHGLIFNWSNAPSDNTKAKTRHGQIEYTLRHLDGFAKQNVHVIRNIFLTCQ